MPDFYTKTEGAGGFAVLDREYDPAQGPWLVVDVRYAHSDAPMVAVYDAALVWVLGMGRTWPSTAQYEAALWTFLSTHCPQAKRFDLRGFSHATQWVELPTKVL